MYMNYVRGYLFLRFKDGREFCKKNSTKCNNEFTVTQDCLSCMVESRFSTSELRPPQNKHHFIAVPKLHIQCLKVSAIRPRHN